jgi:hypothetical protein
MMDRLRRSVQHTSLERSVMSASLTFQTRCLLTLLAVGWICAASAVVTLLETRLASYEPDEFDLTLSAVLDQGLTLERVRGGAGGVPDATHGEHVLRLSFAGEDGKVECKHTWWLHDYDLAGEVMLLVDVYVQQAAALPGLMGIWSANWNPPGTWQGANNLPAAAGQWTTISFTVEPRDQIDLQSLDALVFENIPASDGVIYIDNLRLQHSASLPAPVEVASNAFADRNELVWRCASGPAFEGFHVYRSTSESGPFSKLTTQPVTEPHYADPTSSGDPRYYYQVTSQFAGAESPPSDPVGARYNQLTDEQLLDVIQQATVNYFWAKGHPVSGLIREPWGTDACAVGGTGMQLMAMVVGVERGWYTRAATAERILTIMTFLEDTAARFHGAWPHVVNGLTGEPVAFGTYDDAADIVETSYLVQGLLTVRQYFDDPSDPVEAEIRTRATRMWERVEWDWFRRYPDSLTLWWHWSPNHGWAVDLPIRGYHEAMITYLLAIASPTHPMPSESFQQGWASQASYTNGETYYGQVQEISEPLGGPLFFMHYTFMGFDPRFKRDAYTNYFVAGTAISRIHQAYAIDNPRGWAGYHRWSWGLTASAGPDQYLPHSPTNDTGTIAPTAALSSLMYTPRASTDMLRYLVDTYGTQLFTGFGLYDAFNPSRDWFANQFISIDQGPIVVNIENHRSGLCWRLFMSNPEIRPMLDAIGFEFEPDLDHDGVLTPVDGLAALDHLAGPDLSPLGDSEAGMACDQDGDGDVDAADWAGLHVRFGGS